MLSLACAAPWRACVSVCVRVRVVRCCRAVVCVVVVLSALLSGVGVLCVVCVWFVCAVCLVRVALLPPWFGSTSHSLLTQRAIQDILTTGGGHRDRQRLDNECMQNRGNTMATHTQGTMQHTNTHMQLAVCTMHAPKCGTAAAMDVLCISLSMCIEHAMIGLAETRDRSNSCSSLHAKTSSQPFRCACVCCVCYCACIAFDVSCCVLFVCLRLGVLCCTCVRAAYPYPTIAADVQSTRSRGADRGAHITTLCAHQTTQHG